MKEETKIGVKLGAVFYPKEDENGKKIDFDSLYIPYIYKEIYLEGIYIDIMNGKKDMVILDIGGNLGLVTQYMRDHAKIIYTVEPSIEHFTALKKNKEFNNWDNVEVFNMAISGEDGEAILNKFDANRTCNSLVNNYNDGGETVITKTFNTFFKENKIDTVDFMKFDVEGAEESILCNPAFADIAPKIKSMMVEFHYPSFPKIVDHLIDLGYTARRYPSSAIIFLFEHA
jgi:FkbM family methyltransferase